MTRIAIIDHDNHNLFVDDISDEILEKYNGEEEAYIEDNYDLENYSWDYIVSADYFSSYDGDPIEIDFESI